MSNLYCDLDAFKKRLNITGTADDVVLLVLLEHASRALDQLCNRFFYIKTETRYYDGAASPLLLDQDLVAVTSLKTDDNGSGDWETAWAATDYELLPYNGSPKYAVAVARWGGKADFNRGLKKTVEIAGRWGYLEETGASGASINEGGQFSASDTTLTVTDGSKFKVGQTLLIESEQLYIQAISANNLTVQRGVNGATAAAHPDATAISVYRYPRPIVEACLMQTARSWKRKDAAFSSVAGMPEVGRMKVLQGLDPDVAMLLAPFRRIPVTAV